MLFLDDIQAIYDFITLSSDEAPLTATQTLELANMQSSNQDNGTMTTVTDINQWCAMDPTKRKQMTVKKALSNLKLQGDSILGTKKTYWGISMNIESCHG